MRAKLLSLALSFTFFLSPPMSRTLCAEENTTQSQTAKLRNFSHGSKLTASSHLDDYLPQNAADGDYDKKESRWVSGDNDGQAWLQIDFGEEINLNALNYYFWRKSFIATDFYIQANINGEWKQIHSVSNNQLRVCRTVFPTTTTASVRTVFTATQPDNLVRIYEVEAFSLPAAVSIRPAKNTMDGVILDGEKPGMKITLHESKSTNVTLKIKACSAFPKKELEFEYEKSITLDGTKIFDMQAPAKFGSYLYEVSLCTSDGKIISSDEIAIHHYPRNDSPYQASVPFGAHYHGYFDKLSRDLGLKWLRAHDVTYNTWSAIEDDSEVQDWTTFDEKMAAIKRNGGFHTHVLISAPQQYSTILPGELQDMQNPRARNSWTKTYYPPANLDAWLTRYVIPVTQRVSKAAPYRAYEIWNEAWSYYRLRGLHGTPAEAFNLFKITYDALKEADPQALAYSTDVKPECIKSRYAFKNFGREMLDLGYLRFTDLLSLHGYGNANLETAKKVRSNAWDYGRDYSLWVTETSIQPYNLQIESLVLFRAYGIDKTFTYNNGRWGGFFTQDRLNMNATAHISLLRHLGEALYLGSIKRAQTRTYYFVNGNDIVAAVFTDSKTPLHLNAARADNTIAYDLFGNEILPENINLQKDSPVFIFNPPATEARKALENGIIERLDWMKGSQAAAIIKDGLCLVSENDPDAKFFALERRLREKRHNENNDYLFDSNGVLDLLANYRLFKTRHSGQPENTKDLASTKEALKSLWTAINSKTGFNGALLNSERLASRAQKQLQTAQVYEIDGDLIARDIFTARALDNIENATGRIANENVSKIYKAGMWFRSHKRFIRSDTFCFPNGRWQKACITVGNPFGKPLSGKLSVKLPDGWKIKQDEINYNVKPLSRQIINVEIMAPNDFVPDQELKFGITDTGGNLPAITVSCEIVNEVPPKPVLRGSISGGALPGN